MVVMIVLSYLGSFGGKGVLVFPWDVMSILPFSILVLYASQFVLVKSCEFEDAKGDNKVNFQVEENCS